MTRTWFLISLFALLTQGCSKSDNSNSDSAKNTMPLGAAITGVTFAGALTGKQLYLLDSPVNAAGCWVDSEFWSGTELFFGVASVDYTALSNGTITYNSGCNPTPGFDAQSSPGTTGNFNVYRAEVTDSEWALTNLPINLNQTANIAAPKLDGSLLVFVNYEKSGSNGNIYLSTRTGDDSYTTPVAFSQNSAGCDDDNPTLFNNATQMIFTSSRTAADGSTCSGTGKKTFWSSTYNGSVWSTPVAITGAPATATNSVDQAWVDSTNSVLYWTGTGTDCSGTAETCIMTVGGSGTNWASSPTQIATPLSVVSWPTDSTPFTALIGQYTVGNGYAFTACGVTIYVGSSTTSGLQTLNSQSVFAGANSPGPPYYYYHTDIKACVIPL